MKTFLIICLLIPAALFSQKENNIWMFGGNAGIDFNTPVPTVINTSGTINANEGCASICDNSGNLLFYTDALKVYDRTRNVMPNGNGLLGGASSTMAALILPKPGDCSKYYVFTTGDHLVGGAFYYSIVDMCMNGGFGDVTSVKNVLIDPNTSEKLTAVKHTNGKDVWIITHLLGSGNFNAYLLSSSGFSMTPVVSTVGSFTPPNKMIGYMKASHNGKKLASCTTFGNTMELFDFNASTGVVSNAQDLTSLLSLPGGFYGLEFSPNDSLLYATTTSATNVLHQIKLYPSLSHTVIYSYSAGGYVTGSLQLGPNNKIYMAHNLSNALDVINNPNNPGLACNLTLNALPLNAGSNCQMGLPNFTPYSFLPGYNSFNINLGNDTSSCSPNSLLLDATSTCNSTYLWNTGATTNTINTTGPGKYYVKVSNICGQASDTLLISPLLATNLTVSGTNTICAGSTTTLSVTGSANYTWSPVSSLSTTSGSITIANPGITTTYSVFGDPIGGGCNSFAQITVNVNPTPVLSITGNSLVCDGSVTTLHASGAQFYSWAPVSNLVSGTGSVVTTTSLNAPVTFSVTGTSTQGCTSDTSYYVDIVPTLTLGITGNSSTCSGQTTTLTANGASNYIWDSGITTASTSVNPTVTTTYTVTGITGACSSQTLVTVNVSPLPNVAITGNTLICPGETSTLTASGANTYTWSNNAAASGITVNPLVNTTYTVTGTTNNCQNQAIIAVNVMATPTISVMGNTSICSGQTSSLTANGAQTFSWSTGSQNSTILISPATSIVFTVTGTTGGCSSQTTVPVTVIPIPTLSIIGNQNICSGQTTTLTANGANSYIWDSGITTASINVNPTVTTIYTVTGITGSCSSQTIATVNVSPLPSVAITGNTLICLGETSTLTASGANTYTWNTGSLSSTIFETPTTNSIYSVTGTTGNCSNTAVIMVVPSTLSTAGNTLICNGDSTLLSASGAGSYIWSSGATSSNIMVHPQVTTSYNVTGIIGSCVKNSVLTVSVMPTPVVTVNNATICPHQNALLVANGADSYSWSNGSTFNLIRVSPTVTTTYTVTGTTRSCTNNAVASVSVFPEPTALYSVTPNPLTSVSPFADFMNLSVNYNKWWWNFGDASPIDTINMNPSHFYNTDIAAEYPSSLTVANSYGCMSTFSIALKAEPEFTFYIPNAFSPTNKDGLNDIFTGYGVGIKEFKMMIFDRWGTCIYSTNDITRGWNGCVNNKSEIVPQDSYVWKVDIKDVLGKDHFYVGHVTLFK